MTGLVQTAQDRRLEQHYAAIEEASERAWDEYDPDTDVLPVWHIEDVMRRVEEAEPVGFLFRPVWPADAYGVVAAQHKAGKTWIGLDAAVSVASGTPWLGVYEVERPGPVVVFLGEGGERKMARRLQAVAEARGISEVWNLPIHLCFKVPKLGGDLNMLSLQAHLTRLRPALVILDPLYLAASNANSADLNNMGAHLQQVQAHAQAAGSALVVVHHWNQSGTGSGAERMSGAGPAEWGRVLVSVKAISKNTDPVTKASNVTLAFTFVGDEIPDTEQRFRRTVWADDPDDLNSPMHYTVEALEAGTEVDTGSGFSPAVTRVLGVLTTSTTALTVTEVGDVLANDSTGMPLKRRTIQDALIKLQNAGLAESELAPGTSAYLWASTSTTEKDVHAV